MGASTTNTLYSGSFDNQFWASVTTGGASSGTGNLYVVGARGGTFNEPKLAEIRISANGLQTGGTCQSGFNYPPNATTVVCSVNVENPMTSAAAGGSPLTEIYDGTNDWLFASVTGSASNAPSGCSGACVESWNAKSTLGTTNAVAGSTELGGTSGIIVDNVSSTNGASQIYFSTLGTSGSCTTSGTLTDGSCAVQASQTAP
jgi:hypothetical protein